MFNPFFVRKAGYDCKSTFAKYYIKCIVYNTVALKHSCLAGVLLKLQNYFPV